MLGASGSSLEDVSTSVSAPRSDSPIAESSAPPVPAEFWQPFPAAPEFPHGHAPMLPSPGQNGRGSFAPRSRRNTSKQEFVSPGTRLLASDWNATYLPSAEIDG